MQSNDMHETPVTAAAGNLSLAASVPRYGSKRDVAAMVQMSVRSVDNFVAAGCPHLRVSSRRLRFDMAEVRCWLADNFRRQHRAVKGAQ